MDTQSGWRMGQQDTSPQPVRNDVQKNLEAITRAIEFAAREKADVFVTPEGSLSGYSQFQRSRHGAGDGGRRAALKPCQLREDHVLQP